VVDFDSIPEWSLGKFDLGYKLTTEGETEFTNLNRIFELIPRDRIGDVGVDPDGNLLIEVNCECFVDIFEISDRSLVIDIKDGMPDPNSPFEQFLVGNQKDAGVSENKVSNRSPSTNGFDLGSSLNRLNSEKPVQVQMLVPSIQSVEATSIPDPRPLSRNSWFNEKSVDRDVPTKPSTGLLDGGDQSKPNIGEGGSESTLTKTGAEVGPDVQDGDHATVFPFQAISNQTLSGLNLLDVDSAQTRMQSQVTNELSRQMGRAAAQGLVNVATDQVLGSGKDESDTQILSDRFSGNINIQTSMDRDSNRGRSLTEDTGRPDHCVPAAYFDVSRWGVEDTDRADIGRLRSGLLGEFDEPQQEAILGLAKYYIYLTFGAEAQSLLNEYLVDDAAVPYLISLAAFLDQGEADRRLVSNQLLCGGPAVMWAFLTIDGEINELPLLRDDIIQTYFELPVHLQIHLGYDLLEKLVNARELEAARLVRNTVMRIPGEHDELLLKMDEFLKPETGTAALDQVDPPVSSPNALRDAEATADLLEFSLRGSGPIEQGLIENGRALAFQYRGSEVGIRLKKAEIRSLLANAQFDQAHSEVKLAYNSGQIDKDTQLWGREVFFQELVESGDDAVFLKYVFDPEFDAVSNRVMSSTRLAIAERLTSLGFFNQAELLIAKPEFREKENASIANARIALGLGSSERVPEILEGQTGPMVQKILAESTAVAGKHSEASDLFQSAGMLEKAYDQAWLAEDWSRLGESSEASIRNFSELMMAREVEKSPRRSAIDPTSFSSDLDSSEVLRTTVRDLLEAFPLDQSKTEN
jgi:hypothetical protein